MKKLRRAETIEDRILSYYLDGEKKAKLTPKEDEKRIRYDTAFTLLRKFTLEECTKILIKQFDVSRATAYEDLRTAIRIYGDITRTSKEGYRSIIFEKAERVYQKAEEQGDLDNMNKAIANMIKIKGIDQEDFQLPDWANVFQQNNIIISGTAKDFGLEEAPNIDELLNKFKTRKRQTIPIEPYEEQRTEQNLLQ